METNLSATAELVIQGISMTIHRLIFLRHFTDGIKLQEKPLILVPAVA
jgi:hypothetical protein